MSFYIAEYDEYELTSIGVAEAYYCRQASRPNLVDSDLLTINAMRFNRWLWAGMLLLSAHTLASFIPSIQKLLLSSPAVPKAKLGHTEPTSASACQLARSAVLTLYASSDFGSGSIVSPEGLVLTNQHVVKAANNGQVNARSWSGKLYKGQVIATDSINDLALVQLNTKEQLPEIRLAKPADAQIGQKVCAVGSPFGRTGVITLGTLKATQENGDLQASILLHPGNSGGPLLNSQGEMIGVNKAIWLSETGENVGIGFATATTIAQNFIEQNRQKAKALVGQSTALERDKTTQNPVDFDLNAPSDSPATTDRATDTDNPAKAELPSASTTGVRLGALVDRQSLVIQIVEPDSPAERAGLSAGDQLIAMDSQPIKQVEDLQVLMERHPRHAVFAIRRNQQVQEIRVNF